jgi:3-hydroxybutyryl-CoA dehydrogenase
MVNERLLIVGAGTMGSQIALQAAIHGVDVNLFDIDDDSLDRARLEADRLLDRQLQREKLDKQEVGRAREQLRFSGNLEQAGQDRDWVIEAVAERIEVKRKVFADLDKILPPHAAIATNSSSIVSSRIADITSRPDRCLNMHFFHPVLVMDLCEIVVGPHTSPATAEEAVAWARRIHRHPVMLSGEIDGFVVNRILGAASCEAFSLVAQHAATPSDIDTAVRHGLRWHLGPFELADLSGLDVVLDVRRSRYERERDPMNLPAIAVLEKLVAEGRLGRKTNAGFYDYSTKPPTPLNVDI